MLNHVICHKILNNLNVFAVGDIQGNLVSRVIMVITEDRGKVGGIVNHATAMNMGVLVMNVMKLLDNVIVKLELVGVIVADVQNDMLLLENPVLHVTINVPERY